MADVKGSLEIIALPRLNFSPNIVKVLEGEKWRVFVGAFVLDNLESGKIVPRRLHCDGARVGVDFLSKNNIG